MFWSSYWGCPWFWPVLVVWVCNLRCPSTSKTLNSDWLGCRVSIYSILGNSNGWNTYKNFPFIREPFWSLGSESSRDISPWNQGILSCAVVAINFSSLGLWLMMACSRAAPWKHTLALSWHKNVFFEILPGPLPKVDTSTCTMRVECNICTRYKKKSNVLAKSNRNIFN